MMSMTKMTRMMRMMRMRFLPTGPSGASSSDIVITRTNKARKKLQQFQRLGRNPCPASKPNEAAIKQIELTGSSMGLTRNACQRALRATGNDDPDVAIQWLRTHQDDDNIDDPLDLDDKER